MGLALLLTSGCARFRPKPLEVARTADALEKRHLEAPELRACLETNLSPVASWPLTRWSLEQLTLAALVYHPKLDVARASLAVARAAEITAGARPNPTLGVIPEYVVNPLEGVSPWITTIQLDIPIETAGKRGARIQRARHLSEAARLRLGVVAWEIRSAVRGAWLDLYDAGQRVALGSRQLAVQQRAIEALETKRSLGAATLTHVLSTRLEMARTQKDLADAQSQVEDARARLAAAIGVPLVSLPPSSALTAEPPTLPALAPADARRQALTRRPDLLAALADYASAEMDLRLEMAKQYPNVHLSPGYQFDQGENQWALGLSAEIPAFHRNQGPIAEAEARRSELAARVLALQARILGEVDRAQTAWQGAQARLSTTEAIRATHEARLKGLEAQFEAGALEMLDVLAAEIDKAAGELAQWEARFAALRAQGSLEDAIQFPLPWNMDLSRNLQQPEP